MTKRIAELGLLTAMLAALSFVTGAQERRGALGRARNVILMVGDGMGDSEISAARDYEVGPRGRLAMDSLPATASIIVSAVYEDNPRLPVYVADSAASGTAWATGEKTSNGRISTSAQADRDLPTLLEIIQRGGRRVGSVTTAELTDATPAVLASHVRLRECQGPQDMANCPADRQSAGGPGSIAEQEVAHKVDVLLGGGRQRFAQPLDVRSSPAPTVIDLARAADYAVVGSAAELATVRPGHRVLGLFAPGNMSLEWAGVPAVPHPGSGPQRCREGQRPSNEPSLAEMTRKAIDLLDDGGRRAPGFFLQVEGASIDKQNHASNPCGQVGETVAFDAAIRTALDFARRDEKTLVIVTADHGHTSQIVATPSETDHPAGAFSTLITREDAPLTLSYATNVPGRTQEHTGTEVRAVAEGPGSAAIHGTLDQTDLFGIVLAAMGLAAR